MGYGMSNRARIVGVLVLGFAGGVLVWWASPLLFNDNEPWDAGFAIYCGGLALIGLLASIANPKYFWLAPCGVAAGQAAYIAVTAEGGVWLIGVIYAIVLSLSAFGGSVTTYLAYRVVHSLLN